MCGKEDSRVVLGKILQDVTGLKENYLTKNPNAPSVERFMDSEKTVEEMLETLNNKHQELGGGNQPLSYDNDAQRGS